VSERLSDERHESLPVLRGSYAPLRNLSGAVEGPIGAFELGMISHRLSSGNSRITQLLGRGRSLVKELAPLYDPVTPRCVDSTTSPLGFLCRVMKETGSIPFSRMPTGSPGRG
jgi:hypothetical protein